MVIITIIIIIILILVTRWQYPRFQQERAQQELKTWLTDNSLLLTGLIIIITITNVIMIIIILILLLKKGKAGHRAAMAPHDFGQTRGRHFDGHLNGNDTDGDDDVCLHRFWDKH